MNGQLVRFSTGEHGTFGNLTIDNGFKCVTAELPWHDNQNNISRIPVGKYECEVRLSWRFRQYLYEIKNVPGRQNVLIHRGNYAGDVGKGFRSDVEGCVLLGEEMALLTPEGFFRPQMAVLNSKETVARFMKATNGEKLVLTVMSNFGSPA